MAPRRWNSREGKKMRCRRGGLASARVRKALGYPNARATQETFRKRREAKERAAKGLGRTGFVVGCEP